MAKLTTVISIITMTMIFISMHFKPLSKNSWNFAWNLQQNFHWIFHHKKILWNFTLLF